MDSSTAKSNHIYGRLPANHILLLHILPSDTEQQLQCQLIMTEFHSAPSYEAVSYAWGHGKSRKDILLSSHSMRISEHVFIVMNLVREDVKTTAVWIGALCIDQYNYSDKGT
jgi:hypothetical protein